MSRLCKLMRFVVPIDSKRDHAVVTRGRKGFRSLILRDFAYYLIGFAALLTASMSDFLHDRPAHVVIGIVLGLSALGGTRRAMAYLRGWVAGRQTFVSSLAESAKRDMTFTDWLTAEQRRTLGVLGWAVDEALPDDEPQPKHRLDRHR